MKPLARFYKVAEAQPAADSDGFTVHLDGKALKTPARLPLVLPNVRLAQAVAAEWNAQSTHIRYDTMPNAGFTHAAIDRVAAQRDDIVKSILGFGETDLLCYRAATPADLVHRETELWTPLVDWARDALNAPLVVTEGIGFVRQPEEALTAFARILATESNFVLAGLSVAASLCGSLVIALALRRSRLDADAAFAAARLPELYQTEKWGEDAEARLKMDRERAALQDVARYFALLGAVD